ncbi:MAG: histidine kinase, partial [Natronospirillum sp.]
MSGTFWGVVVFKAVSFVDRGWRALLVSLGQTALACLLIAVVISLTNELSVWLNLWLSLGFGFSIVISLNLLYSWRPEGQNWLNNFLALATGVTIGMVNVFFMVRREFPEADIQQIWLINLVVSTAMSGAVFYFFYSRYQLNALKVEASERQRQAADRERLLTLSQLRLLQSQIEPHFLFNTLANIQGLVDMDPLRSKQMIAALTQMLRANLQRARATSTTLAEELNIARCYLDIQSIRMGERFSYEITAPVELNDQSVPPMLL